MEGLTQVFGRSSTMTVGETGQTGKWINGNEECIRESQHSHEEKKTVFPQAGIEKSCYRGHWVESSEMYYLSRKAKLALDQKLSWTLPSRVIKLNQNEIPASQNTALQYVKG